MNMDLGDLEDMIAVQKPGRTADFATAVDAPLIRLACGDMAIVARLRRLECLLVHVIEPWEVDFSGTLNERVAARMKWWNALTALERQSRNEEQIERNRLADCMLPIAAVNHRTHQTPMDADVLLVMQWCHIGRDEAVRLMGFL